MDGGNFITLKNGYRIWYKIVGSGKGIPLLTLHGGPGAGHDYLEPLEALGDDRPVIFYDQLGCGKSDKPRSRALWTIERFMHRGLSGMLAVGPVVVVGDADGYVHFIATTSGETQLRLVTDGSPIVGTPVVSGTTVLVTTRDGGLFAFRPH